MIDKLVTQLHAKSFFLTKTSSFYGLKVNDNWVSNNCHLTADEYMCERTGLLTSLVSDLSMTQRHIM